MGLGSWTRGRALMATHPFAPQLSDELLWTLSKTGRQAVCWQTLHPFRLELRIDVDGSTRVRQVVRNLIKRDAESNHLRMARVVKGWQPWRRLCSGWVQWWRTRRGC